MRGIPGASPIVLTADERAELEDLARSTKTEYRLRQRARMVLLAAAVGMASRAIGREVGCTTGTASKWRVRYARDRLAGLDETGDRGAAPKYRHRQADSGRCSTGQCQHGRWTGPLIAAELGDVDLQYNASWR
jgi:transposase